MGLTLSGAPATRRPVKAERAARLEGDWLTVTASSGTRKSSDTYWLERLGRGDYTLTKSDGTRHFCCTRPGAVECDCEAWKRGYLCRHVGALQALEIAGRLS